MKLTFKKITDARTYLIDNGFSWSGQTLVMKGGEIYEAGPLTAIVKRKPFGPVSVSIR